MRHPQKKQQARYFHREWEGEMFGCSSPPQPRVYPTEVPSHLPAFTLEGAGGTGSAVHRYLPQVLKTGGGCDSRGSWQG